MPFEKLHMENLDPERLNFHGIHEPDEKDLIHSNNS